MITYFKNLIKDRYVIASFVKQDLRARYRGSALGILWAILMPLGTTSIIAAVYAILWQQDIHYFVPYLFSGLIPWTYITGACDSGVNAYISSEGYIKQLSIHNEIFPVRAATSIYINSLLFGLVAYFIVLLFLAPGMLSVWTLMLFPALLLFYLFGVSMATIAASAQVYIRDYAPTQSLILQALFYVTPILYDYQMMDSMGYDLIYKLNPFFYLIQIMRDALMGHPANALYWGIAAAICLMVFACSQLVFCKTNRKIVFRL